MEFKVQVSDTNIPLVCNEYITIPIVSKVMNFFHIHLLASNAECCKTTS